MARAGRILTQWLERVAAGEQEQAVAHPSGIRRLHNEPAAGTEGCSEQAQRMERRERKVLDHLGADDHVVGLQLGPELRLLRLPEIERNVALALPGREPLVSEPQAVDHRRQPT
jgi:hypothetical protein